MDAPGLRLLLVDDEPLARLRLRSLLQAEPGIAHVAEAGGGAAARALLDAEGPFDALLLDIGMPGEDGLRLAAALRARPQPPAVVFVTAHGEHALRAFELEALDYLTKPVRRDRLQAALQRVQARRAATAAAPAPAPALAAPAAEAEPAVLVIPDRDRLLRVPLAEVLLLRAGDKQVMLHTATQRYLLDDSLAELTPRLGPGFVRIHRNAIARTAALRALVLGAGEAGGWGVQLPALDLWLPVSRRQLATVKAAMAGAPLPPPDDADDDA